MTKELVESNHMEVLLRTSILRSDLHRTVPVREITISDVMNCDNLRKLYPCCKIVAQIRQNAHPASTVISSLPAKDSLILYQFRKLLYSMTSYIWCGQQMNLQATCPL